jgi:hypothetical protein
VTEKGEVEPPDRERVAVIGVVGRGRGVAAGPVPDTLEGLPFGLVGLGRAVRRARYDREPPMDSRNGRTIVRSRSVDLGRQSHERLRKSQRDFIGMDGARTAVVHP